MEIPDDAPIQLASLRRWQPLDDAIDTNPLDTSTPPPQASPSSSTPFPVDAQVNARIALWHGPLWRLAVDAVVNSTNEALTDTSGLCRKLLDAAGKEIWTECATAGPCRTGEAVATRGCRLPARKILHTVAPRYSEPYQSAAEHALHMCYRSALSAAVELKLTSVAFPCVYVKRKGYPRDAAAHVAARTVRRFLEHYREALECVVFCVDSLEDQLQYEAILPLYFPRSRHEEIHSARMLDGRPLGDAFGEPVIEERKIRISESLSTQRPEKTLDALDAVDVLDEEEAPDEDAAVQSFCEMSVDPDVERLERLRKLQTQRERQQRQPHVLSYHSALAKSHDHDWRELTKRKFLYHAGVDHSGDPVIVYMASRLSMSVNGDDIDLDRIMHFILQFMDAIVDKTYSILYVHSDDANSSPNDETQLSAAWLKRLFKTFASKYQQNLRFFYVYEPSMWLKLLVLVAKGFVNSAFYKKIVYVASPEDLAHVASALDVPHYMDPKHARPPTMTVSQDNERDNKQPKSNDAVAYPTLFPRKPEAFL